MTRDLPGLLRDLKREYLAVEGLMASPVNKGILPMFITNANDLYKELMLKCQSLGENDILPDSSNVTKSSVIKFNPPNPMSSFFEQIYSHLYFLPLRQY